MNTIVSHLILGFLHTKEMLIMMAPLLEWFQSFKAALKQKGLDVPVLNQTDLPDNIHVQVFSITKIKNKQKTTIQNLHRKNTNC